MATTGIVENYPGFEEGIDGFDLGEKMQQQAERFGAKTVYAGVEGADLTAQPKLLHTDEGDMEAKTVIIATGGAGRMHYQGFPTSNHYGATADGLVLGYRVGAKLLYADTLQYHPTGAAFPQQIFGALVTEKVRSLGAKLVKISVYSCCIYLNSFSF